MTAIHITPDEVLKARGTNHFSDMDLITSPKDGMLVAVAMHHGCHVCWACGELFDGENEKLRGTEKQIGTSRVLLHRKCAFHEPKAYVDMATATRGLSLRRMVAKGVQVASKIIGV